MSLVYLIALVLGGGTLLVQLLSGLGHGADHDWAAAHHPLHGPGLLSTRSLTFGLLAFGLVGAPVHILGLARPVAALALAVASGLASGLLVGLAFRTLGNPEASGAASLLEAKGLTARVLVACAREQRGKVRVALKGQLIDVIATTEATLIPAGASVRIVEVRDEVAHVVPAEEGKPWSS